ncbi:hypothetical protein PBY51_000573 [Eleginops maclovinus]|uniref:Uncharacterized protein n=1 Tax=Eleginops maclovinus TaxID=56733 RepID=A0AAN8APA4_ELEMC|nr:hypothetical protein PBY51_000573 [Eleginops maclovinus]
MSPYPLPCGGQVPDPWPSRKASWQPDCDHLLLPASAANNPGTSVPVQHVWCQLPCAHCSLLNAPNAHGKEG